jgi:hypothetical protein
MSILQIFRLVFHEIDRKKLILYLIFKIKKIQKYLKITFSKI